MEEAMTEAQEEFVRRITACRSEIVRASGELDAIEGHGPGGESAVGAALAALDAAVQIEEEFVPRPA
ncbi:MAG TPA: hypothetical protein VFP21_08160 [Solirubrobacterales bacterium]|jgi:hypothetical protein|nr:hypothetical protein [Solirubrobacterales bacterium]